MSRPRILVTNDDGIVAPGIRALVEVAKEFGDVVVVAPDKPQSGQGHAITLTQPLRLRKVDVFEGVDSYECSGTPADCVKLARDIIYNHEHIDLCLSGINHGANSSINIIYSGTMSAAMEASLEGTMSIGFSLLDFSFQADFKPAQHFARIIIESVLKKKPSTSNLLNVNIPKLSIEDIKGIKVCAQGRGNWVEEFSISEDPRGEKYYWLTGKFQKDQNDPENSDIKALKEGYVSVVPSMHDLTQYKAIPELKFLEQ